MFHLISFIPHFIVHASSHCFQSTPHCSCFISFPSVHTSLFMFHLISFSPHFIDHVSSHFFQSTLHCSCFILLPSVHTSLFMFHLISFSPQSISFISSTTVHLVPYLVVFILHGHSTSLQVSLFSQFRLWNLTTYECL